MDEVEDVCPNPEETTWIDESDISQLCRVCANPNEYLIPIFHGEGIENDLHSKISKHLPIKVSENDTLPVQLCYQCASTLIAWHDMVNGCMEADEKLRSLLLEKEEDSINVIRNEETCIEDQSLAPSKASKNKSLKGAIKLQPIVDSHVNTVIKAEQTGMGPSFGADKVVGEEIIPFEPAVVEVFTQERLSFRNYQAATLSLKDKLLVRKNHLKKYQLLDNKLSLRLRTKNKEFSLANKEKLSSNQSSNDNKTYQILTKVKPTCNICDRTFNKTYDLKRHSLVHFNVEHFDSSDTFGQGTSQVFVNKNNPLLEMKSVVMYSCEVCSRTFKVKDSFERHKRIHTGERPFKCGECAKRFRDSGGLLRHVREVHEKVRNHLCNICHKWFVNRPTLEDHLRSHSGERPFVCHQCGLMFKSKSALYQHSKTHSDSLPHGCGYCGKGFRRRQELIAHTLTHTNEKKHICEKCGKGFRTRSELQRHIVVHSDEKPFSCLVCGLSFSQKRYLKNHTKSRHGRTDEISMPGLIPVDNLGCRC